MASSIIIWLLLSIIVYFITLPKKAIDMTTNLAGSVSDYIISIYQKDNMGTDFYKNFNWIWDTAPPEIQKTYPIAPNLSLQWPPPKGSRFRMTAFPYPDTGKSKFWLFQFLTGISSLLDNTTDQVTFPGWQISIYDPLDPHNNTWAKFLTEQIKWDPDTGAEKSQNIHPQDSTTPAFTPVFMEVMHSCYVPPTMSYPYCDDGGYWLYGTSGSGIFWSSGGYHPKLSVGGTLVANNKIDAMLKLLHTTAGGKVLHKIDPTMTPIKYLHNALKDGGGGTKITTALKAVIDAFHHNNQIPKIVAFRTMEPSYAKTGWLQAISLTFLFTITLLIMLGICISRVVKRKPWFITFVWITSLIVAFGAILIIEWSFVLENMLRGFGYLTLDMALEKTGMTLDEFIYSSAGRDPNGNPFSHPSQYNSVANSLAQTQMFDFDLDTFCFANKLDSIIMHTQPNKSGSWAVEIMDIRNTPYKKNAKDLNDLVYPLGLCGKPIKPEDKALNFMPELLQGPVSTSTLYLGYQPNSTNHCNCNESAVAKQYDGGDGTLKKCLFCTDTISHKLC